MYEVHVLAIYHVANAEIECFWGGGGNNAENKLYSL